MCAFLSGHQPGDGSALGWLPLLWPLLKAQVNPVFDQAQINRDRAALPPLTATTALPELLRKG